MNIKIATAILVVVFDLFGATTSNSHCTTQDHRPRYHFSIAQNWLYNPNGLIYHDGVYHMYYTYHPATPNVRPAHSYRGHAVSRNLVTWGELGKVEIHPDPEEIDDNDNFVFDPQNTTESNRNPIIAIYTIVSETHGQRQRIAISYDNGTTFTSYEHNTVLPFPLKPEFCHPKVVSINGEWVMAVAVHDRIEFFSSSNMRKWKLESEFGSDPSVGAHGGDWICPDLFSFEVNVGDGQKDNLWILLVGVDSGGPNNGSGTQYFVGNLTKNGEGQYKFESFEWNDGQWLDLGPDVFCGVTFSNMPNDRHVYIGSMNNHKYGHSLPTDDWRGQMTIPRELDIKILDHGTRKYRLLSRPIKELKDLRNPFQHFKSSKEFNVLPLTTISLTEQATFEVPTMELSLKLNISENAKFSICAHNSMDEETCFGPDGNRWWYINRARSGKINFHRNFGRMLHSFAKREINDEVVSVNIFLDVSSIEVFVDDGLLSMTALHFPNEPYTKFFIRNWAQPSVDSTVTVKKVEIWGLLCWYN